jgi:HAMP domain-containing protein
MPSAPPQRKQKLIPGSFQARLVSRFVGLAALALLLQFLLLGAILFRTVSGMDGAAGELYDQLPMTLVAVFGLSLFLLLPILFAFGVTFTFRIAGPLFRIERFLAEVARGETDAPCQIRAKDELQELCSLANAATETARAAVRENRGPEPLRQAS